MLFVSPLVRSLHSTQWHRRFWSINAFFISHLPSNTDLMPFLNCVSGKCISGLTKEKLILVQWITHCAQKLATSFNYTNNQVTKKAIQFITNLIAFWDLKKKKKVMTERTHPNGRGPKELMGVNQDCRWIPKVAPLVHLKLAQKRKVCWAPLPQKIWGCETEGMITPVSGQNIMIPSQITAVYPILLTWSLRRKSPFDCCAWLTWRNNKFSKQDLFSK